MTMTVTALYVYPIKSCGGISVLRANLSLRGFSYDREWMLIDANGVFMTQRTHPKMCLIETGLTKDYLEARAPAFPPLRVWLDDDPGFILDALVHKKPCKGNDQGVWASAWFTAFLEEPCRLVRILPNQPRRSKGGSTDIAYADAHEILLISWASLNDLNARLETPVPMNRFRPNIVVSGCVPYAEDGWNEINVASVRLIGAGRCVRCVVTTTDQATGTQGKEPLTTLASYRKMPEGVVFGRNFNGGNGGQIDIGSLVDTAPRW